MADLSDEDLARWLQSVPCAKYEPIDMQRMALELQRLRASKLTEREERLALSALGYWSSDNDYAPHEEIAELRVKLSRPK